MVRRPFLGSLATSLVVASVLVALVSVVLVAPAPAEPGDWTQWRGPARDGVCRETGLLAEWSEGEPKLLFLTEGFGDGYASLSVADGKLFTTGNFPTGQAVVAADAATGEILWKTPLTDAPPKHGYEGSRSTPTVDGERLYVVGSDGRIACLETATGKEVWSRTFAEWGGRMMSGWGFSESPLVDGDLVLCTPGGPDAMIVALDKQTGDEVWAAKVPDSLGVEGKKAGAGYASIVVSEACGVKQYVTLVGQGLIGVRAADGEYLWGYGRIANTVANIPTPIPHGDEIFTSSGYGDGGTALVRLSEKEGKFDVEEVYYLPADELQNHHGGMVRLGDYVYFGAKHNNGFPVCVAWATGEKVWGGDFRGEGKGSAAVLAADGSLVFRYQSGEIALIEATPEAYRLRGVLKPQYQERESWAHPVIAGGKLYLREQGKLMCYDLRKAS